MTHRKGEGCKECGRSRKVSYLPSSSSSSATITGDGNVESALDVKWPDSMSKSSSDGTPDVGSIAELFASKIDSSPSREG